MIEVTVPNGHTFEVAEDMPLVVERWSSGMPSSRSVVLQRIVYPVKLEPGDRIVVKSAVTVAGKAAEVKAALDDFADDMTDAVSRYDLRQLVSQL